MALEVSAKFRPPKTYTCTKSNRFWDSKFKSTGVIVFSALSTDTESCSGEEKLWHGEPELAKVTSDAGDWGGVFPLQNMFDNNEKTFWHSDSLTRTKIITIDFQVRIMISNHRLIILKRLMCM